MTTRKIRRTRTKETTLTKILTLFTYKHWMLPLHPAPVRISARNVLASELNPAAAPEEAALRYHVKL